MVRIMQQQAKLVCINPNCGKTYSIKSLAIKCDSCNFLLDVKYENKPSSSLKEVFYERRNPQGSIYNESGVWRFRELLNFCEIETEDIEQCSKISSVTGRRRRKTIKTISYEQSCRICWP